MDTAVPPIDIKGLSKRFGAVRAVSDLSFKVEPGRVIGFLGPNGAGKSTTLRMLLGLVRKDAGEASFGGLAYEDLPHPSSQVGAVLEDASFHPGRSGRNHLRVLAAAGGHPRKRVDDVLEQVGLADAADRRVKGYSMGMRQRLAIAAALLGDPEVLILDEPTNGLDPPGIRWMRDLVRAQAGRGRAVLVSSHLLSEVAQSVDDVVIISHGKLRASGPLEEVLGGTGVAVARVRSADDERLAAALREAGRGALLQAELIKLRTTRTFLALAGVAVGTSLLLAVLVSLLTEPTEDSVLADVFTSDTTGLFILILAVVGISGEWRHRTITSSLLAAPDRLRFLAAKTVAFAVAGLALSLVISLAVAIAGLAILAARDLPTPDLGELATQIGRNGIVAMLLGALGVGLGALVRNQVVAIVGVLVVVLVVEPLLLTLEPEVGRFGPFTLPSAVAGISEEDAGVGDGVELPSPGLAAAAMLAWIGAFYAAGATLLRRRDLD